MSCDVIFLERLDWMRKKLQYEHPHGKAVKLTLPTVVAADRLCGPLPRSIALPAKEPLSMNSNRLCKPWEHEVSRRQWLGSTAAASGALAVGGLGGLVSPAVAEQLAVKDKQVLFIWIDGGMSQYESWDPKPGTQFGGPYRPIQTSLPEYKSAS